MPDLLAPGACGPTFSPRESASRTTSSPSIRPARGFFGPGDGVAFIDLTVFDDPDAGGVGNRFNGFDPAPDVWLTDSTSHVRVSSRVPPVLDEGAGNVVR